MGTVEGVAAPYVSEPPAHPPDSIHAPLGELRRVADLLPHPGLVKYSQGYSTQELSSLSERGEAAFADPITITHENVIVDGYAVWQLAKLKNRADLTCIVRSMDQEDALLYLLTRHRGSKGIGDFARVLIALELEPWFRDRAKFNQRFGGRAKGSTHLAEADKVDVRIEVARAAGVSAGNVSKVKQIVQSAIPAIHEALLSGEIQINRASTWAKQSPSLQVRRLSDFRNEHGMRRTIAVLLSKHKPRHPAICDGLRDIQQGLRRLHADPVLLSLTADLFAIIGRVDHLLCRGEVDRAA